MNYLISKPRLSLYQTPTSFNKDKSSETPHSLLFFLHQIQTPENTLTIQCDNFSIA